MASYTIRGHLSTILALYCNRSQSSSRGLFKFQLHKYYKKPHQKKFKQNHITWDRDLRGMIFTSTGYIFEVTCRHTKIPIKSTHSYNMFILYINYHSIAYLHNYHDILIDGHLPHGHTQHLCIATLLIRSNTLWRCWAWGIHVSSYGQLFSYRIL